MDPIAHSLVGASMARTGLKKLTPLAMATLIIAANLPDIDGVFSFISQDAALLHRRGITHGVAALIIMPMLLAMSIFLFDRFVRQKKYPGSAPAKLKGLLILSYIGVLSHPLLDWLNTYGVRLLMPFDGRWFYGDLLFIIDPWVWLVMAAALVIQGRSGHFGKIFWVILGAATSALILSVAIVPGAAKLAWCVGVAIIIALRFFSKKLQIKYNIAAVCFGLFFLYIGLMSLSSKYAKEIITEKMKAEGLQVLVSMMVGPMPANPFLRHIIVETNSHYHGLQVNFLSPNKIETLYEPVDKIPVNSIIERALKDESIKGFVNWMRFPLYDYRREGEYYLVTIRDLRYVNPNSQGDSSIGVAQVLVPVAD